MSSPHCTFATYLPYLLRIFSLVKQRSPLSFCLVTDFLILAMFISFRANYMDTRAEDKKPTGDEKYHPPTAYDLFSGASDDDESTMTLLGDGWGKTSRNQRSNTKSIFYLVLGLLIVICISAVIYLSVTAHSMHKIVHLHPTGIELGDCGSSHTVEEARAKGCLFDP